MSPESFSFGTHCGRAGYYADFIYIMSRLTAKNKCIISKLLYKFHKGKELIVIKMKDIFGFEKSQNTEDSSAKVPDKDSIIDPNELHKYIEYRYAVENYNDLKLREYQLSAESHELGSEITALKINADAVLDANRKKIKDRAEAQKNAIEKDFMQRSAEIKQTEAYLQEEEKKLNEQKLSLQKTAENLKEWRRTDVLCNTQVFDALKHLKQKGGLGRRLTAFVERSPKSMIHELDVNDYNVLLQKENSFHSSPLCAAAIHQKAGKRGKNLLAVMSAAILGVVFLIAVLCDVFGEKANSLSELAFGISSCCILELIAYHVGGGFFRSKKMALICGVAMGIVGTLLVSVTWAYMIRKAVISSGAGSRIIFSIVIALIDYIMILLLLTRDAAIALFEKIPFIKNAALKLTFSSASDEEKAQIYCYINHDNIVYLLSNNERNEQLGRCTQAIKDIDNELLSLKKKQSDLADIQHRHNNELSDLNKRCAEIDSACRAELSTIRLPEDEIRKKTLELENVKSALNKIRISINACSGHGGFFSTWTGEPVLEYIEKDKSIKAYVSDDVCIESETTASVINHSMVPVTIIHDGKEEMTVKTLSPVIKNIITGFVKMIPSELLRLTLIDVAGNGRITNLANPARTQYGLYASEELEKKKKAPLLKIITGSDMKEFDAELDRHCNRIFMSYNENAAAIRSIEQKKHLSFSQIDGVNRYTREKNDKLELNPYHIVIIAVPDAQTKSSDSYFALNNLEKIIKDNDGRNYGILPVLFVSSAGVNSSWEHFVNICKNNIYKLNTRNWSISPCEAGR